MQSKVEIKSGPTVSMSATVVVATYLIDLHPLFIALINRTIPLTIRSALLRVGTYICTRTSLQGHISSC